MARWREGVTRYLGHLEVDDNDDKPAPHVSGKRRKGRGGHGLGMLGWPIVEQRRRERAHRLDARSISQGEGEGEQEVGWATAVS